MKLSNFYDQAYFAWTSNFINEIKVKIVLSILEFLT